MAAHGNAAVDGPSHETNGDGPTRAGTGLVGTSTNSNASGVGGEGVEVKGKNRLIEHDMLQDDDAV